MYEKGDRKIHLTSIGMVDMAPKEKEEEEEIDHTKQNRIKQYRGI